MPKHEFGIMTFDPQPEEVFEVYEPEKYNCITVDDDYIEVLLPKLSVVDCFWHTLYNPNKNLAYCGITLIPPDSMDLFIELIDGAVGTEKLKELMIKAKEDNKYIIHFGI